jgi:hypothetical protein
VTFVYGFPLLPAVIVDRKWLYVVEPVGFSGQFNDFAFVEQQN